MGGAWHHAQRHRPRECRDDAPHPHGRGQRLRQPAAARIAHESVRRLGWLDDRDRTLRHHVRHPEAGHVAGEPRRAAPRPSQYRDARAQPASVRCDRRRGTGPRTAGTRQVLRRDRHQRGRTVLHRQRDAHAQGRPNGRQPPHAGAGADHRRARGDGRRLSVHHAVGRRCREVLPHQGDLNVGQGEVPRRDPCLIRPEPRRPGRPRDRADGS